MKTNLKLTCAALCAVLLVLAGCPNNPLSPPVTPAPTPVQLAAPTVTPNAGDTKATLSWPAVPNAVSYELVWNGGVSKPVTSPHEETGLVNGTAYTYKLIAKGDGSSYTDSEAAEGRVHPAAGGGTASVKLAKPVVTALAGDTKATLSWPAVPNAVSYELVWNGGVSKPVTSPHTEIGLTNGTAYSYSLIAKGDGSNYTDSHAASGSVMPEIAAPVSDMVTVTSTTATIVGADITPPAGVSALEMKQYRGVFVQDRTVHLSPYEIGKCEVTYEIWKKVYDWALTKGYVFAHAGGRGGYYEALYFKTYSAGHEKDPVTAIGWGDAIVWCNAYTEMIDKNTDNCVYTCKGAVFKDATKYDGTGTNWGDYWIDQAACDLTKKGFRLPTEAEWEFAARGAVFNPSDMYAGTNTDTDLPNYAWYKNNSSVLIGTTDCCSTHEVGTKTANALGIHDMNGNVEEWCWDWLDTAWTYDVGTGVVTNPTGPASAKYERICRGRNFFSETRYLFLAYRTSEKPGAGSSTNGFRLARTK